MTGQAPSAREQALKAHQSGQATAALPHYQRWLAAAPQDAEGWRLFGICLLQVGKAKQAREALQRATGLAPQDLEAQFALGVALQQSGQQDAALARFETVLIDNPRHAAAHNAAGAVWQYKGQNAMAEQAYRRALYGADDNPTAQADAALNLGTLLLANDRAGDAVPLLRRAVEAQPQSALPGWRLGRAHRRLGDEAAALTALEQALALALASGSQRAEIAYDRALCLLALGRYAEGFAALEARAQRSDMRPWPTDIRIWAGEPLSGKQVFVLAEQGQGDQLQFCRYVPALADQGARVVLEAHPRLLPLLQGLPGVAAVVPYGASPAGSDFIAPLLSLPRHLGPTPEAAAAYLTAPPGPLPTALSTRPAKPTEARRIGLVWSGNPQQPTNRHRACQLDDLIPLLATENCQFFSLQKGSAAADLALNPAAKHIIDLGPDLRDFGDTARALNALDLLITTDTAIAHLAGAMGRPAWVLLAHVPDWRWQQGPAAAPSCSSPWYSSLRLFRQPSPGDWSGAVGAVQAALSSS